MTTARPSWTTAAFALWGLVLAAGLGIAARYETTEGRVGVAPVEWPRTSAIARAHFGATVVMFVHPKCPCTRASQEELVEIERAAPPTTKFVITNDLREAARFGAQTSGHVVVYDAGGVLRFSGGITLVRGHVGANRGRSLVEGLIHGRLDGAYEAPVFGCALEAT